MSEGYVQISLHSHCKTCIRTDCNVLPDDVNCCQIVNCKYRCPLKFHRCKEFQHKKFCRNVEVPCLNRAYGCHQEFPRGKMSEHLPHCNASVIYINDQDIRRSDYFWYAKNVLEDLGGKTLQNYGNSCPYAFAGCDFTYKHFEPEGNRKVVYSDWLNAVGLQITGNDSQPSETNAEILDTKGQRSELPGDAVGTENVGSRLESLGINDGEDKTSKRKSVKNFSRQSSLALCRSLSQEQQGQYTGLLLLPPELIQKITGYLDGFSLCNLSVTCLFFRDICSLILVDKGIVSPTWTKLDSIKGLSEGTSQDTDGQRLDTKWTMPDGSVKDKKWVVKHMSWRFSKTFESVR
ncbi:uncharacterized protein LOC117335846 isoform X2 [Pecten maximus]|uniref:uncharacterized protein LOC117335846 isoform X2 n=1 Tax=Pecten maximus TaxID=6579 RepID=UPI001458B218|nr:uncharacterized protein LOC117335846 isoform X2 [Pecten maximus]